MASGEKHPLARRLSQHAPELTSLIDWDTTERRSIVFVWLLLAACILFLGLLAVAAWTYGDALGFYLWVSTHFDFLYVPLALAAIFAVGVASRAIGRARRELGKYPEFALFGRSAPTLYLREFQHENPNLDRQEFEAAATNMFGLVGRAVATTDNSLEGLLSKELSAIGPLVCLRDPHQRRMVGGAYRLVAVGETWQAMVRALLRRSSLVFMHFGASDSVSWEVDEVVERSRNPLLLWIEYVVVSEEMRRSGDYLNAFPASLAGVLRSSGVDATTLGDADDDRGFLFLIVPDSRVLWRRPQAKWVGLRASLRSLLEEAGLRPTPNRNRQQIGGLRHGIGKALATLTSIALILCVGALAAKYVHFAFASGRDEVAMGRVLCQQGDAAMCYALAVEGPSADASENLTRACELGHPSACATLGANGLSSAHTAEGRYAALLQLAGACGGGAIDACQLLDSEGRRVIQLGDATGGDLLRQACVSGLGESCGFLAERFVSDDASLRNYPAASEVAARGCQAGHAGSCQTLSYLYRCGLGVRPDLTRATELSAQARAIEDRARRDQEAQSRIGGAPPTPLPLPIAQARWSSCPIPEQ